MRKLVGALIVAGVLLIGLPSEDRAYAAEGKNDAAVLSILMPGTGEWLNSGFEGGFPWTECVLGYICPLVMCSSTLDAAAGDTANGKVRLDFWSKPLPE